MKKPFVQKGFSLVELVAIVVLLGVLAATTLPRLIPSSTYQIAATRGIVVTAFNAAQQLAMTRDDPVQLVVSGSQIDVRLNSVSVRTAGTQYPQSILPSQTITPATFNFDRLGQPDSSGTLTISQGSSNISVEVTPTGHVF